MLKKVIIVGSSAAVFAGFALAGYTVLRARKAEKKLD